jgi:SAM-dependent methyltransferase
MIDSIHRDGPFFRWAIHNPLWEAGLREMARHFPPSASELNVLDVSANSSTLNLREYRPDLRMIRQDACVPFPLADSAVDAVIGHSRLTQHEQQAVFLTEAMRVLRPGGRLILLDPAVGPVPLHLLAKPSKVNLSILFWYSQRRSQFTLEQMAEKLTTAGFARVLTEHTMQRYGILSRGEKPYPNLTTVERIAQVADLDENALQLVDSTDLPTIGRGRSIFLLVRQTPNKPVWALQPGEKVRWDATMVTHQDRPYLLAFTSLPKAVEFMQPAVTSAAIQDIHKVAKFDKSIAAKWAVDVLLNPSFEVLKSSKDYLLTGLWLSLDPDTAVTGEE